LCPCSDDTGNVVLLGRPGSESRAELLSVALNLPTIASGEVSELSSGFVLVVDYSGLSLQQLGIKVPGPIRCDFAEGALRHRRLYGGGKGQDIAKAVGLSHRGFKPLVLDLTAGLGRDGFVLSTLGATVQMIERHPVVLALLQDGLTRAKLEAGADPELEKILARISVFGLDGKDYLEKLSEEHRPDVVYLDPMFPSRGKSSKVKKEMQLFHQLVGVDSDASELLPLAVERARYRVVVKRPAHAPFLAESKPSYSLKGKSTRFDIYSVQKLP
jgi:16S rRNA (guanine1516-N2)-methyltransferase